MALNKWHIVFWLSIAGMLAIGHYMVFYLKYNEWSPLCSLLLITGWILILISLDKIIK
jgi:hypothetical protein